ncbi:4-coumarate--CoA ligase-like 7 [Bradysia coprophila]|uniref:4-coumarate--CoA ligase-like 7 n=1 Tax=Bradysia coprophila TaxID=38358 RepID=UPI00187DBAF4|nr:4-coumarate--CoA ligase-like 7 [Bradysia coprophila]
MAPPPLDSDFNAETKIWSGPAEDHDKSLQLGSYLLKVLKNAENQDKIVQIFHDTGEEMSVREMYLKSVRLGVRLQKAGVKPGDVVSIISQNCSVLTPLSVGLLAIGAIVSYLDENVVTYYKDERNDLRRVNPHFIICNVSTVEQIMDYTDGQTIITFENNGGRYQTIEDFLIDYEKEEELVPVVIKEPGKVTAVMLPSSGTTGKPKFICLSHAMLLSQLFRTPKPATPYEYVTLNICPMYWISGVAVAFGDLSGLKTRIITTQKSTPELIIELTQKYNVTDVFCNATQLTGAVVILRQLKIELPSLKVFAAGGAAVPYNSVLEMRNYVPNGIVISGYGLTEVAGIVSIEVFGPEGSVGLLAKGIHVKIKGENGQLLGPNESGELWTKTEYEFLDYLNNEPSRDKVIDSEGFLNSNDIAYFDEDGFLYITGRREDILEYLHSPVSSTKIESILASHPELVEVCVVGVRVPIYYDIPTAVVVKVADSKLTAEDIHLWIKDKLPSDLYKLRGGIYFVDELPRTCSGKIKKHLVKMQAFDWYHESGSKIEDFKY